MGYQPRQRQAAAVASVEVIRVHWTRKALDDLARLYEFLAPVNPSAAAKTVQALSRAPDRLIERPRLGEKLEEFAPREVRRVLVGKYEVRYELIGHEIYILRIWHTREHR